MRPQSNGFKRLICGRLCHARDRPPDVAGRALRTGMLGSMIAATVLAIYLVALFYVIVRGLTERMEGKEAVTGAPGYSDVNQPAATK